MEAFSSALVVAAKHGSHDAMERLFSIGGERLLVAIRLRLGPSLRRRLESRDILQATLMKAFASIDKWQGASGASLMAWLLRIAENEIRDQAGFHGRDRRNADREVAIDAASLPELAAQVRSHSTQLAMSDDMTRVEAGIERLEDDHREVIVLRYFAELSFQKIAQQMSRSPDACRVLLARAMAKLTAIVEEVG